MRTPPLMNCLVCRRNTETDSFNWNTETDCELTTFDAINKLCGVSVKKIMQLYHHPYSLDSQKVRLALEEKGIDYTSYHANPLTGKNLDSSFFRMNTTAKLPVFQNGGHIMYDTIEIIKYIERVTIVSSGIEINTINCQEVNEWMQKIQRWNPKIFTLSHVPEKHRLFVSKFIRRVVVARMAEYPDLASTYHLKLKDAYETEEKLKDPGVLKQIEEELDQLLDEVEIQLSETTYLAGEEFTMADVMFIPVLARIELLDLQDKYIGSRPKIVEYLEVVKQRPSYKVVIGKYFSGWRKYRTLFKTWCFVCLRSVLRRY